MLTQSAFVVTRSTMVHHSPLAYLTTVTFSPEQSRTRLHDTRINKVIMWREGELKFLCFCYLLSKILCCDMLSIPLSDSAGTLTVCQLSTKSTKHSESKVPTTSPRWALLHTMQSAGRSSCDMHRIGRKSLDDLVDGLVRLAEIYIQIHYNTKKTLF